MEEDGVTEGEGSTAFICMHEYRYTRTHTADSHLQPEGVGQSQQGPLP